MERRRFLQITAGVLVSGMDHADLWAQAKAEAVFAGGELVGTIEFVNEGDAEMDSAFGSELDGRLFTSLAEMTEKALVTPQERFYLRTRASRILPREAGWTIEIDGLTGEKRVLGAVELRGMEKPLGLQLMECAGNTRAAHFGMISVGEWAGVPWNDLLATLRPRPAATRVLIGGFDKYVANSVTSTPGASWVFAFEQLRSAGAFLATKLDGRPLSRDHGAPVRLVVPGWYGCTCIKWVDRIEFVDETAEATSQMTEYASRTHQVGSPRLAKDFLPARIDHAATPIRVERWRVAGKTKYRVVGLLWGGSESVREMGIRFNPEEEYVRVERLPVPQTAPWTLWSHTWMPKERGTYTIRLAVLEPRVTAKRLESGYYARSVVIEEV